MRTTLVAFLLALFSLQAADALAQYPPRARIWVENDRDYFRRGDRLRVSFTTTRDAFVAVVHVDPDGNLDFLFPASPWDEEYVRGGHVYSLPATGWDSGLPVRGRGGIGYLYLIASPVPLDYSYFRMRGGYGWDWSYAGRAVNGDPFWAMEQLTRMLIPDWGYAPYAADYYSYYVDGPHRYPAYACTDRGLRDPWGWGWSSSWSSYYGSCDRLDHFLRDHPYYFDTRRYRGDRRVLYRDYPSADPRHGYKEAPDFDRTRSGTRIRPPATTSAPDRERGAVPAPRDERSRPESAQPEPRRPVLQRRPAEEESGSTRSRVAKPREAPPAQRGAATPRTRRPQP